MNQPESISPRLEELGDLHVAAERLKLAERMGLNLNGERKGGLKKMPEWRSWKAMRNRCKLESHQAYHRYGGRGISVCERWNSFANFLQDMGFRPEGTSLDRIDTNGNYEPHNCRWSTRKDQCRNTRANISIEIRGIKFSSIAAAAEHFGLNRKTLEKRIRKYKMTGDRLLKGALHA